MKRLLLAPLLLALLSMLVGAAGLGWPMAGIAWQIRGPRTLLALLVGAGLGMAGAALQGALRNPLADPGLLGIGGAAALGAVLAYYWGLGAAFPPALPLSGLAGALAGALVLLGAAGRGAGAVTLVLAGVGVSAVAAALLALALALAPNPFALAEITQWLMGSLADRSPRDLGLAAVPILIGLVLLGRAAKGLDALALGEETAASLGFPARRTLRLVALGCAAAVGGGAAVAGGIGFVGLVVPHLLRPLVGQVPGRVLLASIPAGAALLLAADILVRLLPLLLPLHGELPIGVLTALLGAPALVILARRVAP